MQQPSLPHPRWCKGHEEAANVDHAHTGALGRVRMSQGVTISTRLIQRPREDTPMLVIHLRARQARLRFSATGEEAWRLAGLFVDATVAVARSAHDDGDTDAELALDPPQLSAALASASVNRMHPRAPRRRVSIIRRSFRCATRDPHRAGGAGDDPEGPPG